MTSPDDTDARTTGPASPTWTGMVFDGTWRAGRAGALDVTAPATGAVIATVGAASAEDVDHAVAAARKAQRDWAGLTYDQRASVFHRAASLLEADPDRILRWLVPESGSAMGKARFEVGLVASELRHAAALTTEPYGELLRSSRERLSLARRVPIGVVGVITPFNFPAILSMRSVAPALALGNAVVLKPDPRTPISGGLALAELLAEAGLPEGLLHVLPGGADVGEALVRHPHVPCLSFTGSTGAGRAISTAAAPLLKRLHLELGGNNALVVLPDADPEAAASAGAWGSFLHQGQICMTTGRHLVHSSLLEEYVARLTAKAEAIRVGDPTDPANALGPIIDERQRDKIHDIVTRTVAGGARATTGASFDGLFYRPTVLVDLAEDAPALTEEIFGPVAPVIGYDTVDEAVEIVNSSEYGLSVSLLTRDAFGALELAERVESGAVHINDQTVDDEAVAPFGGMKASGVGGRFGGKANIDTFTELQWITAQSRIQSYPF
ncbi:benzaldehyde dehydrogenase (NAD) [Streptoalloteichus tenebrarius]|uniref:Benzaldehyde dehydrogenase (NAD) n=1 Tax=Streptoalloteichus tenebrarius (strain ATCC 17920 / DSM 40477 / JCM 4838 / CBS 697.72 / NBRC 16177 / NCIMB 11028 / NRRL B-12390 / A12253. 1 / ISP 5477) TaxID=1933 RepID=A0ABT1HM58_STRSD|nr:aldehyde dehydrogenase family protein [Streptoalloteichus tenebrarius]MCP2256580.1 benzaldehyde dehydrogenase (NAD) [Streptoalloteichus tenebrarius]BFF04932.1 benzaldehyde dehydrogenase [Streptoalloteichus tenebrarius]